MQTREARRQSPLRQDVLAGEFDEAPRRLSTSEVDLGRYRVTVIEDDGEEVLGSVHDRLLGVSTRRAV